MGLASDVVLLFAKFRALPKGADRRYIQNFAVAGGQRILPGTQQTSKHSRVSEAKDVWKKDVEEI